MYVIMNQSNHYLKPSREGFSPHVEAAEKFDSYDVAYGVLKTLRTEWCPHCRVYLLPDNSVSPSVSLKQLASLELSKNEKYQTIEKQIRTLSKSLWKLVNTEEALRGQQSQIDLEICDLYHYIELNNLDTEKSAEAVKRLQDALKRRRECKDALGAINIINQWGNVTGLISLVDYFHILDDRSYRPRVLTDLFGE